MPPGLSAGVALASQEVEGDTLGQLKPEPGWDCFAEGSWVCTGFVLV